MGLHHIKKLLHDLKKHHQNEKGADCVGTIFTNDTSDKGLISKIDK